MLSRNRIFNCDAGLRKLGQFFIPGFEQSGGREAAQNATPIKWATRRLHRGLPPSLLRLRRRSHSERRKAMSAWGIFNAPPRPRPPAGFPRPHLQSGRGAAEARGRLAAGSASACKGSSRRRPRGPGRPPPSPRPGRRPCCRWGPARGALGAGAGVCEASGPRSHPSWARTAGGERKWESELRPSETAQRK